MSSRKMRLTCVFEWEVDNLQHWDADTFEEALENQRAWLSDDDVHWPEIWENPFVGWKLEGVPLDETPEEHKESAS